MESTLRGSEWKRPVRWSIVVLAALALSPTIPAYETYQTGTTGDNCAACHNGFVGGINAVLHDLHVSAVNGDCVACHETPGSKPVSLSSSNNGNSPGCIGCHLAPGLRAHHTNKNAPPDAMGLTCVSCHSRDPLPLPESTFPPYYGNTARLLDPCDGSEELGPTQTVSLDNDGDLAYDGADPDCAECGNGVQEPGEQCDDGNTADGDCCSATCTFEAQGSSCDDGLFCNVGETCDGAGTCGGGSSNPCGDLLDCTVDSCDETADQCVNAPDDTRCDDGNFCNGAETCDAVNGCQPGTPVDCDDADICTDDSCNETSDQCDNVFDATNDPSCVVAVCGNGVTDPGEDCDDGNTAAGDCCSPTCAFEPQGSSCDDGLFCNVGETCNGAGTCEGGAPNPCGDQVGCTVDSCDEAADVCVSVPDDGLCDDGQFCNGAETCDAVNDCRSGNPVSCDDANICTDDSCNEASDRCDNVFDATNDPSCVVGNPCPDEDTDGFADCSAQRVTDPRGLMDDVLDLRRAIPRFRDRMTLNSLAPPRSEPATCDPTGLVCGDCDDTDPAVNPGAAEACSNGKDDDCDGAIDQADDDCAACGNGVIEPGEDCDDGNTVDGDCCSATCAFEPRGASCDDGLFSVRPGHR